MKTLSVIAGREIKHALRNKSVIISALIFAIWFPIMTAIGIATDAGGGAAAITMGVAAITLPVGVFMGYIFCADAFLREKRDGTIETLLCTPVSLRRIWEGKAVGVAVPAYLVTLISALVTAFVTSATTGTSVAVDPLLLLRLTIILPIWIMASAGLIGAVQLALGMRENQILGFFFIFGFIFLILGLQEIVPNLSLVTEGVLTAAGIMLVALARFIAGKITKERIVLTIP